MSHFLLLVQSWEKKKNALYGCDPKRFGVSVGINDERHIYFSGSRFPYKCTFLREEQLTFTFFFLILAISCIFIYLFYLFMAVLGLRFCVRAFSSCGKWGPLFIAVRGPLIIAASLVAEHRLQMHRLSNCGSRAQLLRGMWDLPRPGLEPVSPAFTGLVVPWHVGSSQTRARTHMPCIGRQILNHCATREAPTFTFLHLIFMCR